MYKAKQKDSIDSKDLFFIGAFKLGKQIVKTYQIFFSKSENSLELIISINYKNKGNHKKNSRVMKLSESPVVNRFI